MYAAAAQHRKPVSLAIHWFGRFAQTADACTESTEATAKLAASAKVEKNLDSRKYPSGCISYNEEKKKKYQQGMSCSNFKTLP